MIRALAVALALAVPAAADGLRPGAAIEASWRGALSVTLPLDAPVPWRAFVEPEPWRLVVDARDVDWAALDAVPDGEVATWRSAGTVAEGWSRLVLDLAGPMRLDEAWMEAGAAPAIRLALRPGAGDATPRPPAPWEAALPEPLDATRPHDDGGPLTVVLDPGHGGVDPGAVRDELVEARLMLAFARELAAVLRRTGHVAVLTRETDAFVALRARASRARAAGADLMISLHADAVEGGGASGATVYTLSDEASDGLSAELVRRSARDDLLLGTAVEAPGDAVAQVLVELARQETAPRAEALADALVDAMGAAGIRLHKRPRLEGAFTVLKAPDIPSVLLELGFLSSEADRRNLRDPAWRATMAEAVATAVGAWAEADAARRERLRR